MASGNKGSNVPAARPAELDQATIQRLLDQQARDTEVKRAELELRTQELRHTSAHAEKILGAQERDREAERLHERKKTKYRLAFSAFCVAALIGLVVAGMYFNKDQLVGDILKVLAGAIAGALGGYGYSKVRKPQDDDGPR